MEAFDEDFNLTKEYYKKLEAIVTDRPAYSKQWYFEYVYDTGMEGSAIDTFLLYHQVVEPFTNGLAFIFKNHIAPCLDEDQAAELEQYFPTLKHTESVGGETPLVDVLADNPELQKRWADFDALDDDTPDEEFEKAAEEAGQVALEQLENWFSGRLFLYWKFKKTLEPKEIRLMESLLQRPSAQRIVQKSWEEFTEEGLLESADKPFELPDDFFKQDMADDNPREHFYINGKIRARGSYVFTQFINYLADCGYISDDDEVKSLLAYRLTGRCRPEGELPPIQWNGKNGKPYELIYIIRYFSDRGDYKKMRQFFTCSEWVKDRDSSYAHSADSEFRRFMVQLYPEVCQFKK